MLVKPVWMALVVFLFTSLSGASVVPFTVVTDVHLDLKFNPYGSPSDGFCRGPSVLSRPNTFSVPGCDSSRELVSEYFSAARDLTRDSEFVLVLGDLPGHGQDPNEVYTSYSDSVSYITDAWPRAAFFPVLGNNDVITDYCVYENTPEYANLRLIWGGHFPSSPEAASTWDRGAYYSTMIREDLMLVVLNTVIYSARVGSYKPCAQPGPFSSGDPAGQAQWFRETMERAKLLNVSVWVAAHIPPYVDPYNGNSLFSELGRHLWATSFEPYFTPEYPITAVFFGHRHKDEIMTVMHGTKAGVPAFVVPSVSGVNKNFPGIRLWEMTSVAGRWLVSNYVQYFASLWRGNAAGKLTWVDDYTFSKAYKDFMKLVYTETGERVSVVDYKTTSMIADTLIGAYEEHGDITLAEEIFGRVALHCNADALRYACSIRPYDDKSYKECISSIVTMNMFGPGIDDEL